MSLFRLSIAVCILTTSLAISVEAQTPIRGVVLDFDGRGSSQTREGVEEALEGAGAELVSLSDAEAAASRAGHALGSSEGVAAAARALRLDFAIYGETRRQRRRSRTRLRLFDAGGNEIASRTTRPAAAANAATQLFDSARSDLQSVANQRQADEELARRLEEERAPVFEAPAEEVEEEEEDPEGVYPMARLRAMLILQTRARNANYTLNEFRRGYLGSFYPELGLRIESFPLGNSTSAARGLYAEGEFSRSLSLASVDPDGNPVETTAWRFKIQVGYLFPALEDLIRVGPMVGYTFDTFNFASNSVAPPVRHGAMRLGVRSSIRLYEAIARVRLDLGYRYLFTSGEAIANEFGQVRSGWGLDFGASLHGQVSYFTYGLDVGLLIYRTSFEGPAQDPQAAAAEVVEGKERIFYLGVLLGVAI